MIRIENADRMIEALEIMASDNYYPIESDMNYIALCNMIDSSKNISYVDRNDFMEYYRNLKRDISNF